MDIEIKVWLYDILNAINEIDGFFSDSTKDFIIIKATCERDVRWKGISR